MPKPLRLLLITAALAGILPVMMTPAAAAAADVDPATTAKRVGKLESEMRAVQRKVFPGGDAKFFTPDISSAPAAIPAEPQGIPASAPINDLTARVDALERQLRTLTGQVEENQNTLKQLDTTLTKLRGDTEFRLNTLEGRAPASGAGASAAAGLDTINGLPAAADPGAKGSTVAGPAGGKPTGNAMVSGTPANGDSLAIGSGKLSGSAAVTSKAGSKGAATAVKAGVKPATGDPVETAWRAAYAKYTAKDFDAAETGFTDFLAASPKSNHASTAQYLLGRSYAAQSSSAQAAKAYLDGYQHYPKSEQAPDSLIGLGNALTALKKPDQACRALNELQSVYGTKLTAAQKAQAAKARVAAKCES